ncbi:MAG: single-stranded DNA-binding protein [Prochloraceae cyanobacterium]|nr:single-stranded DNA-binding protein [Prochloraceae cyanobacterium]
MTDEFQKFCDILPKDLRRVLEQHSQRGNLIEVVMDLGRRPEARFSEQTEYLSQTPITRSHLNYCIQRVGSFSSDNRAGIEQTLHRISAIRNRFGEIIGLTCRVGRAVYGNVNLIGDLIARGQSILILGRPGIGKTTVLREIARVLADEFNKRVVIVDTSNEIAGDGDIPHPAIGRARRMQVARPELQYRVMIEAVENHMPEAIVIDEIGTQQEALAARSIAERGVQLIGTAHGYSIENLIKNPTLSDLVGGIQSVTLSDREAKGRHIQKSILERIAPPTFEIVVEMLERHCWVVHESVAEAVDNFLQGHQPLRQVRTVNNLGQVEITLQLPSVSTEKLLPFPPRASQWQKNGQILPFSQRREQKFEARERPQEANGQELPLCVYPYGVSRQQLAEAIERQNLPVVLTRDLESAQIVLTRHSHVKKDSKLNHLAQRHQLPIQILEGISLSAITRSLRRALLIKNRAKSLREQKAFCPREQLERDRSDRRNATGTFC